MKAKLCIVAALFLLALGTGVLAAKSRAAATSSYCSTGSCYVTGECCGFCEGSKTKSK